ncbi:phosphoglycerate kinase [Candidatus Nomurabacteria bacterium]|nr:phosphoglycerate kinase [Candidatus Nomurabacteria bacterium]
MKSIKRIKNLSGKHVMVRVDFNVPVEKGKVTDDTRILAALPTIEYLLSKGAKVILLSHRGRPEGKKKKALSLEPIAKYLSHLMGRKVKFVNSLVGNKAYEAITALHSGQVLMLENTRFHKEEKGNKGNLAGKLAAMTDIFVQEGFAVTHRADASTVGIAKHVPAYAGLHLQQEVKSITHIVEHGKKPFVLVVGGAKVATKLPVIKKLSARCDHILIGGALFNTYLKSIGYGVGVSLVEKDLLSDAQKALKKKKVIKPIDVIVGDAEGKNFRHVILEKSPYRVCKRNEAIYDIGPETIYLYSRYIKQAQTIIWNGAIGLYEKQPYSFGTLSMARLIASCSRGKAFGLVGGGETIDALHRAHMLEYIDYVSTGGGAMLTFLAGEDLPGLHVL